MSLIFIDGFDHYSAAQMYRKWTSVSGVSNIFKDPGRFNGECVRFNNAASTYAYIDFTAATTTVVGFAASFDNGDATLPFMLLMDGATSQIDLRVTPDAALQVTNNGTILGATADGMFAFGFFAFIEIKSTISNGAGAVEIRVNGNSFLNLTTKDTQYSGNNYVNRVKFQPFATTGTTNFKLDDLYILNSGGTYDNSFLGECRVQTNYPSGAGSVTDFSSTGTNWTAVSEEPADDDVSYNYAAIVGSTDLYNVTDFDFTGGIFGVQLNATQRKDDVGARYVGVAVKSGATTYDSGLDACLSDYKDTRYIWEKDPNGDVTWTVATSNAAEYGMIIKG